jgi:hypothetical protein
LIATYTLKRYLGATSLIATHLNPRSYKFDPKPEIRYYILREERDAKRIAQKEIDDAAEKERRAATRAAVLKKTA